ncbi:hypothetical protein [Alcaligenes faecalis]|uniref:hypothetical protein n=1 Tax=Alcaligenes faecalis TaxID=511 RepID=UPI0011785A9E|nr:hypothetical protein [Alcaligenes faecalis]
MTSRALHPVIDQFYKEGKMDFSTDQIYVVSGNLVSATTANTGLVNYEDMIHSNLLGQMAADKKLGSRFVDPAAWLSFYKTTVGSLFWSVSEQGNNNFVIPPGAQSLTVQEILAGSFFKRLNQAQINSATKSINLFNQLPEDDSAFILYNLKSYIKMPTTAKAGRPPKTASYSVNLQISIAHADSEVALCNVYFQTRQEINDDLFKQKFTVKELVGGINVFYLKAQILESNYAKIRQTVIDKLGEENINSNILLVAEDSEIPPPLSPTAARSFIRSLQI